MQKAGLLIGYPKVYGWHYDFNPMHGRKEICWRGGGLVPVIAEKKYDKRTPST